MIQVFSENGRLSAWGVAANVSSIKWKKPPDYFPVANTSLNLSGAKIYGIFDDGTEQDITSYCSFEPYQGETVPDEEWITVTAYYTAKSGSILSADINLPVCIPELRLVVDSGYELLENYYNVDSPLFDPDTMPIDKSRYRTWCIWKRQTAEQGEIIIRINRIPDEDVNYVLSEGIKTYYDLWGHKVAEVVTAEENHRIDVDNYHTVLQPTVESFDRAVEIYAHANGLVSNAGYFEMLPIKLGYNGLPDSFTTGVPVHFSKENVRFSWGGEPSAPSGLNDMYMGIIFGTPSSLSNPQDEIDHTFEDGEEGDFCPIRRNPRWDEDEHWEYTHYHYVCAGNNITWTIEE